MRKGGGHPCLCDDEITLTLVWTHKECKRWFCDVK
jgi:hypothetical protein